MALPTAAIFAPRVVIITAFPPELSRWITTLPLGEELPFPAGLSSGQPPLRANRSLGVLGFTSGMRPSRAAASLLALGHDTRLDLRESHWLVAGIAGVDPAWGSIGSVFLPRYLIGLGGSYYIDGEGHVPHGRSGSDDYGPPLPTQQEAIERQSLFVLDADLVAWAHGVASSAAVLPDTPLLQQARAGYTASDEAPAREPPAVRYGDSATGETFWAGRESTQWARDSTRFWSAGRATFGVTQEEDIAYASALSALQRDGGRANASRLVVMRAASDYTYAPAGRALREWFFDDPTHMLAHEAFDALVAAGLPVVTALVARGGGGGDGGEGGTGGEGGGEGHVRTVVEMVEQQPTAATAGETFVLGLLLGVLGTLLSLKGRRLLAAVDGGGAKVSSTTGMRPPRPGGSDDPSYAVENVETARSPL